MGPLAATENHPNPPLRVSKRGPSPGLAELGQRCWTSQVFHRPARISMHVDDALCDKASGLTRICSVLVRFLRAQNNKGPSRSWGRLGPLDLGSALGQRAPGKLGNPAIVPPPPGNFPACSFPEIAKFPEIARFPEIAKAKWAAGLLCMGLFSGFGRLVPPGCCYISASSTMPITNTTKPAAVAAANDRSTLSMMLPRYRRATYPPWLRRALRSVANGCV